MRLTKSRFFSLFLLLALLLLAPALAQSSKPVTLEWDAPTAVDDGVDHFTLYESTTGSEPASGSFHAVAEIPVSQLSHQTGIVINSGKHWFYVTASNWAGESDPSNVLMLNANRASAVIIRFRR